MIRTQSNREHQLSCSGDHRTVNTADGSFKLR